MWDDRNSTATNQAQARAVGRCAVGDSRDPSCSTTVDLYKLILNGGRRGQNSGQETGMRSNLNTYSALASLAQAPPSLSFDSASDDRDWHAAAPAARSLCDSADADSHGAAGGGGGSAVG